MKHTRVLMMVVLLILAVAGCSPSRKANPASAAVEWPTAGWRAGLPEEFGFDSLKLAEGLRALASARLTAAEYCEAALEQAGRFRALNIFSQQSPDDARSTASADDAKRAQSVAVGALQGMPYALKDSVDMVEYFTIAGHPALKDFRPTKDADLVTALKQADAVCIGKTQIPPLAMWWTSENATTGDTGNPFNQAYKTGIVSNDASNRHLNRVQVVPLTSNAERLYPSEAVVHFDGGLCKAMAGQLATVSKRRLVKRAGRLPGADMEAVGHAIAVQLQLKTVE